MFKNLIIASLHQRIAVLALSFLLVIAGIYSANDLPIDILPDLNKPTVTVMTEAPGMSPEEVEQQVSFPIERALAGLPDASHIRSISGLGLSTVEIRFEWGADIYRSRQLVNERLDLLRGENLPSGVIPKIGPVSSIMGEVMLLALHSPDANLDPMELRELADWELRPKLLGLQGVSQVTVIGGQVRQYQVRPRMAYLQDMNISIGRLGEVLTGFSYNTSGGYISDHGSERSIRNMGQGPGLDELRSLPVDFRENEVLLLGHLADVEYGEQVRRGDAGFNTHAAVILSVQKQPGADTLELTASIEDMLRGLQQNMGFPASIDIVFRQADFIERATDNLQEVLLHACLIVILVLFVFLLDARATFISLVTIPISILATAIVFRHFDFTINTMTLGGLAIAIGELVDDAVVGVENVLRRLRQNHANGSPKALMTTIVNATLEVRTAIYNATLIIVIVFVPLFALEGIEGRLFSSLGIAYIVSILASLVVSITITPVLCYYLLGRRQVFRAGDAPLLRALKHWDLRLLDWSLMHPAPVTGGLVLFLLAAVIALPQFPVTFLPQFNEGSLTVNLISRPGTSLETSHEIGVLAEKALLDIPEVRHVGRRTGRAELDDHAEGVHYSELDVILDPGDTPLSEITRRIRDSLSMLPARLSIGQPISHRLDHLLATVRADMAIKIYGPDSAATRSVAIELQDRIVSLPGVVDLQLEQETLVPEIRVRPRSDAIQQYGIRPARLNETLSALSNGLVLAQVMDGERRFDLALKMADTERHPSALAGLLVDTDRGRVPLRQVAHIESQLSPNRITHENGKRRTLLFGNIAGEDLDAVLEQVRQAISGISLPSGLTIELEGRFKSQESARQRILMLASISVLLILAVLYNRYRSFTLSAMVMINIPFALTGGLIALWISGNAISLASLVGFITLAGISARNGILKISHYINLSIMEGMPFGRDLIIKGSLERLAPVLMTALVSALALIPLLLSGDAPGKEILHPVAVVICGGLVSSTLLDTVFTPILFYYWGEGPLRRVMARREAEEMY